LSVIYVLLRHSLTRLFSIRAKIEVDEDGKVVDDSKYPTLVTKDGCAGFDIESDDSADEQQWPRLDEEMREKVPDLDKNRQSHQEDHREDEPSAVETGNKFRELDEQSDQVPVRYLFLYVPKMLASRARARAGAFWTKERRRCGFILPRKAGS
jgi:hypothetical protein